MNKRILFISNHLRGPGGSAGTRSWQQTKVLSETWKVTVVLPEIDPVTSQPITFETYAGLDLERVDVRPVRSITLDRTRKWNRLVFYFLCALGQLWEGLKTRDLACVLTMSLPVTSIVVATILSFLKRVPLVVDVRDLPFETAIEMGYFSRGPVMRFALWLENTCLQRARIILTNSPYYKIMLEDRGIKAERIVVAEIGYDDFEAPTAEKVSFWRQEMLAHFHEPVPSVLGVYCGTFGHVVEFESVLQAASRLKDRLDIGFVCVGSGQRIAEYRAMVAEHSMNVVFLGRVSKSAIQPICRAGDFCIYSAKEGKMSAAMLGNKLFDYLGAERPVLYCGPTSAVSEIIDKLSAGLVSPAGNSEMLSANIERVSDDPILRAELGMNASGYRAAGYTAENAARLLVRAIQPIINESNTDI